MADNELFGNSEQLETHDKHTETHACDLISRQAALDIYDDYNIAAENGEPGAYRKHRKRLLELPSAQQWIPCKTAFPEKENTRVTYQTNAGVIIIDGIYGGIDAYGHRVWLDRERGLYWDDEIVAWMPGFIPEPWKGEENNP